MAALRALEERIEGRRNDAVFMTSLREMLDGERAVLDLLARS